MSNDFGTNPDNFAESTQQYVDPHREQHENGYDAIRLLKVAQRTPGDAGSVLYTDGSSPVAVSWSINPYIAGAGRFGSATAPVNHAAGDVTVDGIFSVATDAAPAVDVKAQVTGAMVVSKWFRAGSLAVLTGATTDGDVVGKRVFVEDAKFYAELSSSNPRINLDSNDYLQYTRSSNTLSLVISTSVFVVTATGLFHAGYASFIGTVASLPANTTAGDGNFLRMHVGTDGAFTAGKEFEVVGDALISLTLEVGTTSHLIGKVTTDGEVQIGGDLNHDGSNVGFFNVAPAARQASGANLTNNVTAGGTSDTIANYTDLVTYANDAAAIRNDIYQLTRKLKQVNDALRIYGLLT